MAQILNVPMEEIYQKEESMVFNFDNQSVGIVNGTNNIYTVPEFLLDNQQKYILKLEAENKTLQEKITLLEEEIGKKSHPNPKGGRWRLSLYLLTFFEKINNIFLF